jgi:hypothetical protein
VPVRQYSACSILVGSYDGGDNNCPIYVPSSPKRRHFAWVSLDLLTSKLPFSLLVVLRHLSLREHKLCHSEAKMIFNRHDPETPSEILNWRLWYGVFGGFTRASVRRKQSN